jgi:hypothetical protein
VKNTFIEFGPEVPTLSRALTCPPSFREDEAPDASGDDDFSPCQLECVGELGIEYASTCDGWSAASDDEGVKPKSPVGMASMASLVWQNDTDAFMMDVGHYTESSMYITDIVSTSCAPLSSDANRFYGSSGAGFGTNATVAPVPPSNVTTMSGSKEKSEKTTKASRVKPAPSYLCKVSVGIEEDDDFHTVKRLIGPAGCNTKSIVKQSGGAKVSIRGRGSVFREDAALEGVDGPLTIYISASNARSFENASRMVTDLIHRMHDEYVEFCEAAGKTSTRKTVRREILQAS